MSCSIYPEGATNEDGADEPWCEKHTYVGDNVVHEMSNGLYRVDTRDGDYIDSYDVREDAFSVARGDSS